MCRATTEKGVVYVRGQHEKENLEKYVQKMQEIASKKNIEIVETIIEQRTMGCSKEALDRITELADKGRINVLCISSLDRLSRELTGLTEILLKLVKRGIKIEILK